MALMYLTHNEGKSVIAERFIRNLKGKIYEKMRADSSKCYLNYLNKLVKEYSNTYHCFTGKKVIDANYSALSKEIETNHKSPLELLSTKIFLVKVTLKIVQNEWFVIDCVKINPWTYKIRGLNEETVGSFYEKELLSKL